MPSSRGLVPTICALLAASFSGCGGNKFDVAPVRGKVTCGGQPVTSGIVTFVPVAPEGGGEPGKAASGRIGPDGTFVLNTYETGDGAIIGRHTVYYAPSEGGDEEESEEGETAATPAPAAGGRRARIPCRFGGQAEAEVVAGENDLTIELSPVDPEGEYLND